MPTSFKIPDFPRVRQAFDYDCGAAVLQAVLVYYGTEVRLEVLIKALGTNKKQGTKITSITDLAKRYGLGVESRTMTIPEVKNFIEQKTPVVLSLQAWEDDKPIDWANKWDAGHYTVAMGFTLNAVIFEDPSAFTRVYLSDKELAERWHDEDDNKRYYQHGIALYGKPKFDASDIRHMQAQQVVARYTNRNKE